MVNMYRDLESTLLDCTANPALTYPDGRPLITIRECVAIAASLVKRMRSYAPLYINRDDLVQEGVIGAYCAAQSFDAAKASVKRSYLFRGARWAIIQYIRREVLMHTRVASKQVDNEVLDSVPSDYSDGEELSLKQALLRKLLDHKHLFTPRQQRCLDTMVACAGSKTASSKVLGISKQRVAQQMQAIREKFLRYQRRERHAEVPS